MKLHDYLESTYVSTNVQLQQVYTPNGQAKTQAVQGLINAQRTILRWFNYPVLLVGYFLVLTKLVKAPPTSQEIIDELTQNTARVNAEVKASLDLEREQRIQAQLSHQQSNVTTLNPNQGA